MCVFFWLYETEWENVCNMTSFLACAQKALCKMRSVYWWPCVYMMCVCVDSWRSLVNAPWPDSWCFWRSVHVRMCLNACVCACFLKSVYWQWSPLSVSPLRHSVTLWCDEVAAWPNFCPCPKLRAASGPKNLKRMTNPKWGLQSGQHKPTNTHTDGQTDTQKHSRPNPESS